MESSEGESTHNHPFNTNTNTKNEEVPAHDCQQQELPDDEQEQPTKIVDSSDDCLVKIFNYLALSDLCKVAIASEWLRPAAAYVYDRKYRTMLVVINKCDDFQLKTNTNTNTNTTNKIGYFKPFVLQENGQQIELSGLKTGLRYLRCFGSSISKLSIDYSESKSKRYQYVHDYINEYCAESLIDVSFNELPKNSMLHFKKPLNNVTTITIQDSSLKQQLPSFSNWFPNVRDMHLCNVRSNCHFIAATLANLQCLSIDDRFGGSSGFLSTNAAADLLRLNPKLQTIELIGTNNREMTMGNLLQMLKHNVAVEKLDVKMYESVFSVNLTEVEQLANEHPSLAELKLWQYQISADNVNVLLNRLSALKKLSFWIENPMEYEEIQSKLDNGWHMAWLPKMFGSQYVQVIR